MSCCTKNVDLKKMVQNDYGKVAKATAVNADEVAKKFGYSKEELENIPEGANLGVSCGNPLAHTTLKEGEVVVDLGSGAGLDCFIASPKVGATGKVYGIDMTPEMLAVAKANAAKRNITNVEFLNGEIEALPLPDGIADVVISNCVINLVPNKNKAFSEIYRVLKPGGRVAISDIVLKKEFPDELKNDLSMFSACFSGAMKFDEVSSKLEAAGFQGILVTDAKVDLNAYKELQGTGTGCCGSVSLPSPSLSPFPSSSSCCSISTSPSSTKNSCSSSVSASASSSCCAPSLSSNNSSCSKNNSSQDNNNNNNSSSHPLVALLRDDFDFNEYASSAKIFAFK